MELVRGLHNIKARHKGCVLTIGNFDGVHFGHQAVLSRLVEKAKKMDLPSAVMIFEPQPREFFTPSTAPARLSRWRDKYTELQKLGIDRLICVSFNRHLAAYSARDFIELLLVNKLAVKHLVVGDDFRFGLSRGGNFATLKAAGSEHGFDVVSMDTYRQAAVSDNRVSSTLVRQALKNSDFKLASSLLGREFSISGRVVYGRQLGRTLGVPTANILLKRFNSPLQGVFLVEAFVLELGGMTSRALQGVANIGTRPTVEHLPQEMQLEVHLFDFSGSLYHKHLHVVIKRKLRDEIKFDSLDALKQQINLDIALAKSDLD